MCPAPASDPVVPEALFGELVGWIAMHTMYDVSDLYRHPPEISFCQVGEWITYDGFEIRVEPELNAAYAAADRKVHLVQPWSATDAYDRSVLLHEYVHVVQLANRDWPCVGAPEMEAYLLQARYLEENGIVPDFDWGSIYLLSICPPSGD